MQPHLDGRYTAFGRVIDGIAVVDAVLVGDRVTRAVAP
jgi:cyclophilin family peptidyl-prolyl cis-trans isomerase